MTEPKGLSKSITEIAELCKPILRSFSVRVAYFLLLELTFLYFLIAVMSHYTYTSVETD